MKTQEKITIEDLAKHFGVSKTTISRALSGKGRISSKMQDKIVNYALKVGYRPSQIAKCLAISKSFNIAVILPSNLLYDSIFFQNCLAGIVESAALADYDIVIALEEENQVESIQKLVEKKKCDGFMLLQSYMDNRQTVYLQEQKVPFVLVGISKEDVYQIDANIMVAAKELISCLIESGCKNIAYIGGKLNYAVNQNRFDGYSMAFQERMSRVNQDMVFHNIVTATQVQYAVSSALQQKADCIVASDDLLSKAVLQTLTEKGVHVPEEMKLASLYNSIYTDNSLPPITSISIDPRELGSMAGQKLIRLMNGEPVEKVTRVKYDILLRQSTQSHGKTVYYE